MKYISLYCNAMPGFSIEIFTRKDYMHMHFATNLLSKSNPNDNPDLNPYKSLLSNPLFTASYLCPDLLAIILESFHD